MRPARFMPFAAQALTKAPGILAVEPWQDGGTRPYGLKVTLATGAQVWPAITAVGAPGEDYSQPEPEKPATGEPPAEIPAPELSGKLPMGTVEKALAAALASSGSPEIARVYCYSDRDKPNINPGVGVEFHSGARIHMAFVHAMRPGQTPGRAYALPDTI